MWKNLLAMFVVLMATSVYAQDAELVFAALDSDGDQSVSREEATANELVSANFAAADTNNDGRLSLAEFTSAFGAG
jgi:Ca2+-binding EF-hand superfamily protein